MYQLEVKYELAKWFLIKDEGWKISIDVDPMEKGLGKQSMEKKDKMELILSSLEQERNVEITTHADKLDFHAAKESVEYLVEVEGESSKQKSQALYSALGQLILKKKKPTSKVQYYNALAFPNEKKWLNQLQRIPNEVRKELGLYVFLVSKDRVREILPDEPITE